VTPQRHDMDHRRDTVSRGIVQAGVLQASLRQVDYGNPDSIRGHPEDGRSDEASTRPCYAMSWSVFRKRTPPSGSHNISRRIGGKSVLDPDHARYLSRSADSDNSAGAGYPNGLLSYSIGFIPYVRCTFTHVDTAFTAAVLRHVTLLL